MKIERLIVKCCVAAMIIGAAGTDLARADEVRNLVTQGNELYKNDDFEKAVELYDEAVTKAAKNDQKMAVAKYDKACGLYKMGNFRDAQQLFAEVTPMATDKSLAEKAKYNQANCLFKIAQEQAQQKPDEAIKQLKNAVRTWRSTLDMQNQKKADPKIKGNIETAKMQIKQLREQKKQQQKQNQNDKNQDEQKNKQKQQDGGDKNQSKNDNQNQNGNDKEQKDQDEQQKSQAKQNELSDQDKLQKQNQTQEQGQEKDKEKLRQNVKDILQKERDRKNKQKVAQRIKAKKADKDW